MDSFDTKDKLNHNLISTNELFAATNSAPLNNRYQIAATSDNTRRAYQADIRHFEKWGGRLPATTESILRYLHAFAETLNPRTLSRHITSLKQWHRYQHFVDPTDDPIVSKTLTGIARIYGKPKNKAAPLLPEHLIKIAEHLTQQKTLASYRDNALLQLGFLGAFRRSELVLIVCAEVLQQLPVEKVFHSLLSCVKVAGSKLILSWNILKLHNGLKKCCRTSITKNYGLVADKSGLPNFHI